ncbi:uncharacterized protein [Coffea arabica]|uniref:Retrovirus-related Pol polyprotein from transposon TNT 1-94-like beta-barrel domain-containing protein n=1 Tax=Coffea arabica TaxID=13443 RepID=A0ABM4VPD4_COFAR
MTRELWDDIQQRFFVRNGTRVHQLKTEVANCKQNRDSIMAYYGRLKKLWDDLNDYDPMPTCSCNGCKCNFVTRLQQRQEEERVHQFLMGLDESSYSNVRSNIITSDPLPNLHRVYSQVTEQEQVQVMTGAAPNRSDPVSFAMKTVSPGPWNSRGDRKDEGVVCSHCQKPRHSFDTCFRLHGYPDWWPGNSTQGRGKGRGNQGRGRGGVARAHVAQGAVQEAANVSHGRPLDDSDKAGLDNLSKADWETLKSLWNTHTNNTSVAQPRLNGKAYLQWLFDTGASHHMTGEETAFVEFQGILPCPVKMPNGEYVMAIGEGTVLVGKLSLKGVLYVPEIRCNLISVSKLARDKTHILKFTDRLCVVQDRTSRMLIGVGEELEGLYVAREEPLVSAHGAAAVKNMGL